MDRVFLSASPQNFTTIAAMSLGTIVGFVLVYQLVVYWLLPSLSSAGVSVPGTTPAPTA